MNRPTTEQEIIDLALSNPEQLMFWMKQDMRPTLLTYAAAHLGANEFVSNEVLEYLMDLAIKHEKPYVREGAILGLAIHTNNIGVVATLVQTKLLDANRDLRELAAELLEGE